ncbi:intracellular coagulation inhibitor 2-like [Homalodisca vitripennis]|uniref:intracellular coagulation inhibitor 2-like n=1 Tax=Homalodisca vitripennis TaxID=197043 RepID=UPI001EEB58A2|nr:intracellular coagulation inhibitor 2-like [Homalodisca vitripennis]
MYQLASSCQDRGGGCVRLDSLEGEAVQHGIHPAEQGGWTPSDGGKLAETSLESILKDLRDTRVEVTIPKFKVEQTLKLKDILQKMGLKDVFSSKANLHGVANGDNLYVSDVIQKTFINVHENGTEAAAATGLTRCEIFEHQPTTLQGRSSIPLLPDLK